MSSQDQLDDFILNSFKSYDLSQYSFRVDVVPKVLDQWRQNFQYSLGPTNPVFIDATLSPQDILVWGYTLQYNQNGVLWRVDPAGRPHPDDYHKFLEQNRVIQRATERTVAEIKPLLANSQAGQASSQSQPNPAESSTQNGDATISTQDTESGSDPLEFRLAGIQSDGTPLFYATKDVTISVQGMADTAGTQPVAEATPKSGYDSLMELNRSEYAKQKNLENLPDDYNDAQKAQHYLARLGFNIGKDKQGNPLIDGDLGVMSASSLIIFQYKAGLKITGKADRDTLAALSEYAPRGMSLDDIMNKQGKQLAAYAEGENGRLDTATLTRIPAIGGQDAYLFESAAVAWANLVQAAAREAPYLNLNAFLARGPISGYRDYPGQVEMWDYWGHNPKLASPPGTSFHGLGVAIDIDLPDAKDIATSNEIKWLEKNAARFGFRPYKEKVNGVLQYVETWHWTYGP